MKVGILGGGQLAQMMAITAEKLGISVTVLDPSESACANRYAEQIIAPYSDKAALDRLAEVSDVITYEFENVDCDSVRHLSQTVAVYPPVEALEHTQDRLKEKTLFRELGIMTPEFLVVDSADDLDNAAKTLGFPFVLKTRGSGYDGKGQWVFRSSDDIQNSAPKDFTVPMIAEAWVHYDFEVSQIAVRSKDGQTVFFPLSRNHHENGILHAAQSYESPALFEKSSAAVSRLLDHLDYVGVFTVEFFVKDGEILANEYAPRVHNSGHWTIEGCNISQFEAHLRAVTGMDIAPILCEQPAAIVNCLGIVPNKAELADVSGAVLHDYGKAARPGRKVGHVFVGRENTADLKTAIAQLTSILF